MMRLICAAPGRMLCGLSTLLQPAQAFRSLLFGFREARWYSGEQGGSDDFYSERR